MDSMDQESERLHIGGIDPSRLTVKQVLDRVLSSLENQVSFSNISSGESYCHLNAVSLEKDRSALEIVGKLYNNVKWKGCKISVQAAKPHFLERLALEQQQRAQQLQIQQPELINKQGEENKHSLPRHLKVKRGYGEECYRVDTKPCRVTDQENFVKMRQKLQRKRQQHGKNQSQNSWNRAVHLRFSSTEINSGSVNGSLDEDDDDEEEKEVSSSAQTDGTSSSDNETGEPDPKLKAYVWSDDSDSDSDEKLISKANNVLPTKQKAAYVWSDDDDSTSSSDQSPLAHMHKKNGPSDERMNLDEFSAGIDAFSQQENPNYSDDDVKATSIDGDHDNNVDIQRDVQSNLNILASIFPDLTNTQAHNPDKDEQQPSSQEKTVSGWGNHGQMLRYDPNNSKSASEFTLEKAASERLDESGNSEDDDSASSLKQSGEKRQEAVAYETTNSQAPEEVNDIYEEEKLERVFRESREQVTADIDKPTEGGGFSFGFELEAPKTKSAFSFSFEVPQSRKATADSSESIKKQAELETQQDGEKETLLFTPKKKARMGIFFSKQDIDHYVRNFYSLNNGNRIMKDLEGYRNDPSVQQEWDKQRRILTEDWKRKRKHAQNKRQKM